MLLFELSAIFLIILLNTGLVVDASFSCLSPNYFLCHMDFMYHSFILSFCRTFTKLRISIFYSDISYCPERAVVLVKVMRSTGRCVVCKRVERILFWTLWSTGRCVVCKSGTYTLLNFVWSTGWCVRECQACTTVSERSLSSWGESHVVLHAVARINNEFFTGWRRVKLFYMRSLESIMSCSRGGGGWSCSTCGRNNELWVFMDGWVKLMYMRSCCVNYELFMKGGNSIVLHGVVVNEQWVNWGGDGVASLLPAYMI